MFTFTNDSCLQRTKRKKETGKKEKKCKEGRKDEMSITEKETGNPNKRERDREAEGRRGKKKEKRRGNNEQRACKGYSRIYYMDIYSLF